jgi:hypothetical protein
MKKISKLLSSLALCALLLPHDAYAGITKDTNMNHGHEKSDVYLNRVRLTQNKAASPLKVHVIPHSHDDVGWLKTVDEYFSGTKYLIQRANVELIIDNVMRELIRDKNKHFS